MRILSLSRLALFRWSVFFLYLGIFTFLAIYDEPLNPAVKKELSQTLRDIRDPGNGWVAILGVTAPQGEDLFQQGLQVLEGAESAMNSGTIEHSAPVKGALEFKGEVPALYQHKDGNIFSYVAKHQEEVRQLLQENSELLNRYDQLLSFTHFTEAMDYGHYMPMTGLFPLRGLQRARLLDVATQAAQGDIDGALQRLNADHEFWRMCARESRTVISKLITMVCLDTVVRFAAEIPQEFKLTNDQQKLLLRFFRPYDQGEVSLTTALRGERRFMLNSFIQHDRSITDKGDLSRFCYKPNTTQNRLFAFLEPVVQHSQLSAKEYAQKKQEPSEHKGLIGLPYLYNPIGEILAVIAIPQFNGYVSKTHYFEGRRRLAYLKALAYLNGVPRSKTQSFLNRQSPDMGNPYTEKPMEWDSGEGVIFFHPLPDGERVEILL